MTTENDDKNQKEKKDENLLDKDFDGIRERNNPIPKWFQVVFFSSLVFAVGYFVVYHFFESSSNRTIQEVAANTKNNGSPAPRGTQKDPWSAFLGHKEAIENGSKTYQNVCAACHGEKGQGLVGSNLTDDKWIVPATLEAEFKVIADGIPEKGMLSWKGVLGEKKIYEVMAFLHTIENTNVPGGKAAQGENQGPLM